MLLHAARLDERFVAATGLGVGNEDQSSSRPWHSSVAGDSLEEPKISSWRMWHALHVSVMGPVCSTLTGSRSAAGDDPCILEQEAWATEL